MRRISLVALLVALPSVATGDVNDVVLSRLALPIDDGAGGTRFVPQNADLRSLSSQLGVVLPAHLLQPVESVGGGGVPLPVEDATTTLDSGAACGRAREGSPDPDGVGGRAHGPSSLSTVGFFVRKGMWF